LWGVVNNTDVYFIMIVGWVPRNRVFARIFRDRQRDGKKPGFFGARGARNRVFARSFVTTHKFGKKPGFF